MNNTIRSLLSQELCPDGIWQLSDVIKSILRLQISRLPKDNVSEDEARYPKNPTAMRAFLIKYFCRHYIQTQNSLIKYITSQDFYNIIRLGHLSILDIGSGPAVTSLAITDMLERLLKYLEDTGEWPKGKKVKVDYILNDTCSFCLGTGKNILANYFQNSNCHRRIIQNQTISIQKGFPDNLCQLQRIRLNINKYDLATFSYVIRPMNEEKGFKNLVLGLFNIEKLCNSSGRILILQDRFRERLIKKISRAIGISGNIEKVVQQIFPKRNLCDIFTYFYYCCLYIPTQNVILRQNSVA